MTNTNVTPITEKQLAQLAKFTISATLDGFPITIEGEGRASDLRVIVDRLKAVGAEPPAAQPANVTPEPTKKTATVCPDHGTPMKSGRRGFFCPKKVGDSYCTEVA